MVFLIFKGDCTGSSESTLVKLPHRRKSHVIAHLQQRNYNCIFTFPVSETITRHFHPPDDQSRSDKQLMIFDAFERMSGYTYFGIIDHDEFLIPSNNRSLKNLLVHILTKTTVKPALSGH